MLDPFGDCAALYSYLKGYGDVEVSLFSHVTEIRGNGRKWCQGRFRLELRKCFSGEVGRHWNKLSRVMVKSLSLEVFKKRVDISLSDIVYNSPRHRLMD